MYGMSGLCLYMSIQLSGRCKADVDLYKKVYPAMIREEACTGGGICASVCPMDAIEMV